MAVLFLFLFFAFLMNWQIGVYSIGFGAVTWASLRG